MNNNKICYWFVFCNDQLLLEKTTEGYSVPHQETEPIPHSEWTHIHELSLFDGETFYAYSIDTPITGNIQYEMVGLRATFSLIPHTLYLMAGKAQEIIYWDKNNRYCPVCGMPMKFHTEISKRCTVCGKEIWPTVATAIIVLVKKENKVLLVRARNFRGNYYGLVAGFVETGETLEECVQREVWEETGLRIKNIRYFGSQPWPYPCGLMVGFTADYAGGELKLQATELCTGDFFSKENLPDIPGKMSMARMLIDNWLENQ